MAQEGVKFLYNALPALGQAAGTATVDVEPVSMPFRDAVITLDASPDALRSEAQGGSGGTEQREAPGGEPGDDEGPGLGGFGDFFALGDPPDVPAAGGTPAKAAGGATLEQGALKATLAAAEDSEGAPEPGQLPWARASRRIRSPLLRLHNEIAEFCRFLEPTPRETAARQAATERVSAVITAIWPRANIQVFGSFATGLYLPTSDMDLVVTDSGCGDVRQGLRALAQALARKGMAKNMQVVAKAKVPIIKFEEAASGFNFDISFDVANGPVTAAYVRELMAKLPPMRPLLFILKIFLQQREMNEVYLGGIGSYALLVMVAAFLQSHVSRAPLSAHSRAAAGLDPCLGVLLLDFFRLYGRSLFADYVGVSCRKGATFFDKRSRGHYQYERPFMLSVEDPNDPDNDLAKGSYNAPRIRQAFEYAYMQLARGGPAEDSLLARVIRLDTVLTDRPRPPPPPDYVDAPLQGGDDSPEEGAISLSSDDDGDLPMLVETKRQQRRREQAEKKAASKQKKERKKRKRVRERDAAFGDVDAGSDEGDYTPPPGKLRRRDEPRHHSRTVHSGGRVQSAGERAPYNVAGGRRDPQQGRHSSRGDGSQHASHHQPGGSKGGKHGHGRSHHSDGKRRHIRFD